MFLVAKQLLLFFLEKFPTVAPSCDDMKLIKDKVPGAFFDMAMSFGLC